MENELIYLDIEKTMLTANGKLNLSINTSIKTGDLVTLFGPSGAGKTTILRILAGLTNPDRGVVKFGNTVWFDSNKNIHIDSQKRNISLMFQDYALFPNMTVEENIRYAQPKKDYIAVNELLSVFGLRELKKRKPNGLSGGQKQRVALARALARKPKLLLLDEPLSALDAEMRTALQNEIAQAHQILGATTIMVSHDLAEVFRLANSVICLENGKITAQNNPMQLFSNNDISGKVQITGQIVNIQPQDTFYILTIITGINQIIKVIAFENDIINLKNGDRVMVFSKGFNPVVLKI